MLHGWFVQPRPFTVGPLSEEAFGAGIEQVLAELPEQLPQDALLSGTLTVRFVVSPAGAVQKATILVDTLRTPAPSRAVRDALAVWVLSRVRRLRFPKAARSSVATLPLVFG